ncbi:PLP-dependent transferase [Alkanindiges sp. WGS2144]|uniref:PLP-dependent transferase n=1 Tax=Alkanindiges sp. WGS2144 TaxID=3366808 RepID=UPI0037501124
MSTTFTPVTRLIHPQKTVPDGFRAVQPPVYRASTVFFEDTSAMRKRHWQDDYDYSYGLHGTPTTYALADRIAELEGGKYCILAPSGLSAISLVNLSFLNTGDEVWLPDNVYGPNKDLIKQLHQQYGVDYRLYDPLDVASFKPGTKARLIWLEAAGSVTLEFPDLCGLVKKAQAAGVLTVLDNTWGAGLAFCPFDFGAEHLSVDISIHALTKYPSGGADILMGSVVSRQRDLHLQLLRTHALHGTGISGDDAERVIRSLASLPLRYEQQNKNTRLLADWLQQQQYFSAVLHPALAEAAGHAFWQQVCGQSKQGAGLVSVLFKPEYSLTQIDAFCDALQLFKLGFSWGGPVSLVMSYDLASMRALAAPQQGRYLLRFCVGLEDIEDLKADLAQAMRVSA